jgi:hypothetical protein
MLCERNTNDLTEIQASIQYLPAQIGFDQIGFDTAELRPPKVWRRFEPPNSLFESTPYREHVR